MSWLNGLMRGSFLSEDSLLQARDHYQPRDAAPTAESALAQWAERAASQPEHTLVRELAGLPNDTLSALASAFVREPVRRRTDALRFALPGGVALAAFGGLLLLLQASLGASPAVRTLAEMQALGLAALLAGVAAACVGALSAFKAAPVELAYGRVGLYVGPLNEQHPWLYDTLLLMRNAAAEAYRRRTLRERGPLRGLDCLMMREIARAEQGLAATETARRVAEAVQQLPEIDAAVTEVEDRPAPMIPALREAPQLGARSELRPLRGGLDAVGASVRPFGNSAFDRRRADDAQSA